MDPSKNFITVLCADRDYLAVPRLFYQRWWNQPGNKVTMEDVVGNTFDCYPEMIHGRSCLRTETNQIRRLYFIPTGGIMEMKYVGRSHFKFKIPLSSAAPVQLSVEDDGADASSIGGDEEHLHLDYPDSDDGGEVLDSGPI